MIGFTSEPVTGIKSESPTTFIGISKISRMMLSSGNFVPTGFFWALEFRGAGGHCNALIGKTAVSRLRCRSNDLGPPVRFCYLLRTQSMGNAPSQLSPTTDPTSDFVTEFTHRTGPIGPGPQRGKQKNGSQTTQFWLQCGPPAWRELRRESLQEESRSPRPLLYGSHAFLDPLMIH
jgi:hypothetical protein